MRGAATKSMSDIVEERQQSRYAPFAAAPLRAAARRPAGFVARSSHTAPGIARRSRLASGPGGLQQNVNLFLREPLARSERFLRTPGTRANLTNAPRQGRGDLLQPLPGCVSLFVFYPGVRFAHPRLSSSCPAGAEFGATETVPPVSGAMNANLTEL